MNSFNIPFDIELANSISKEITTKLLTFFDEKDIKIFDVQSFIQAKQYEPCISSIFIVSEGGSYDYEKNGTFINIHNGTLISIDGFNGLRSFMNEYSDRVNFS
jgi:hypothetical protein